MLTEVPPTATPVATATPTHEPPVGFRRYVNGPSDVSLWVPESWTIIEPGPHSPILQSYPQDKYVGGEARQPGDTKCDLTVHSPGTSVAGVVQEIESDPFVTIDRNGVGALMKIAVEKGRAVNPNLEIGICGEHGGEAASVAFCNAIGLDYVSCSPYRVPLARLAAARAVITEDSETAGTA